MNGYQQIDCEAYVKRIDKEHDAVKASLLLLRKMLTTCNDTPAECGCIPHEELKKLREELSRHFHEEEAGGCLEEAACRCPSLTHEVTLLEGQHRMLLQKLDELISATPADTNQVPMDLFHEFESLLLQHECKEGEIIRHGFNIAE